MTVEQKVRTKAQTRVEELQQEIAALDERITEAAETLNAARAEADDAFNAVTKTEDKKKAVPPEMVDRLRKASRREDQANDILMGLTTKRRHARDDLEVAKDPYNVARQVQKAEATTERLQKLRERREEQELMNLPTLPPRIGVLEAAMTVLLDAGKPMHYKEITNEMVSKKLWTPKGSTPAATVNARLSTKAKAGDTFTALGGGVYDLKDRQDASA